MSNDDGNGNEADYREREREPRGRPRTQQIREVRGRGVRATALQGSGCLVLGIKKKGLTGRPSRPEY
jgi:hypothetical protein